MKHKLLVYLLFSVDLCAFLKAENPPAMPKMKPIMNPPPVITLGIENTIISIPHAFLFSGLNRNIIAAKNTRALLHLKDSGFVSIHLSVATSRKTC